MMPFVVAKFTPAGRIRQQDKYVRVASKKPIRCFTDTACLNFVAGSDTDSESDTEDLKFTPIETPKSRPISRQNAII